MITGKLDTLFLKVPSIWYNSNTVLVYSLEDNLN